MNLAPAPQSQIRPDRPEHTPADWSRFNPVAGIQLAKNSLLLPPAEIIIALISASLHRAVCSPGNCFNPVAGIAGPKNSLLLQPAEIIIAFIWASLHNP
ncbi:MAG: hypothetical protein KME26_11940 [Oscillatoria princeps RMCB-10]|jgi:hypothetical protein|nr:hypothetical protein [Oscillatoria princeps RMCB-10]